MSTTVSQVRQAEVADLPKLARLGARFLRESPYAALLASTSEATIEVAIGRIMRTPYGVCFIAESDDGEPVGLFLGMITEWWLDPQVRLGAELAWWVEPEHRKSNVGMRLYREFDSWAISHGAQVLSLSDLIDPVDEYRGSLELIARRLGYKPVERAWLKEVS